MVCKKYKYTVAVRETGEYSIRRIADGAKPKPHTILEKSIKPSSVDRGYGHPAGQTPADSARVLRWLRSRELDGFVGHWNQQGRLIGVRIDNPPAAVLNMGIVAGDAATGQYVPINIQSEDGGAELVALKSDPRWKRYLYTGDYDLHEAYAAQGGTGGGQIPEATREKVDLLNRLNAGIAVNARGEAPGVVRGGRAHLAEGAGGTSRGAMVHMEDGSDYAMFQHGDQATYRMNQHLEAEAAALEQGVARLAAQLVRSVATETDEPLAWCRMGQWYVTANQAEHAALRDHWKLRVPHTWGRSEVERTASGGYPMSSFTG